MSLGAVSAFIVRAVMPRRSLCCRTMPKSPSLRLPAVADEHVERRQVAVQQLAAVQLAEHLEDAGDLAPRRGSPASPCRRAAGTRSGRRAARTRAPGSRARAPPGRSSGNASKTRIARGCPSSSWPKYASRSQPSMRRLTLMQTVSGTSDERPSRAREIDLAEPALAQQALDRYWSRVSGLVTTCPVASRSPRWSAGRRAVAVRVAALENLVFTPFDPLPPTTNHQPLTTNH